MAETKTDQKLDAQQPSPEAQRPDTQRKPTPAELLAYREALLKIRLAQNSNAVEEVLQERVPDQRQEQRVNSTTLAGWSAVTAVVINASTLEKEHAHRKAMERIRDEMFELLAKEEKKRQMRDSPFFTPLVGILGHSAVESITQTLEKAGASGLPGNNQALAQAAKDVAAALEQRAPHLKLSLSGDQLSKALEAETVRALALAPKQGPALSIVRPEDTLATQTHEKIFARANSEDRLIELQKLRASLNSERFAAVVDAYDRKYGIPLAAHVAISSSASTAHQQEIAHEARSLLTPEQQRRLADFGRAELAQSLALVQQQREAAEKHLTSMTQEVESASRHLVNSVIGKPDLSKLPADQLRDRLLEELIVIFPELKGKTWEAASIRLKEVAGQTNDKVSDQLLKKLCGNPESLDLADAKERATRAAALTQRITDLEQKIAAMKETLSRGESPDERSLKDHYAAVYGKETVGVTPEEQQRLGNLARSANAYFQHLTARIGDPELSSSQRQALIQERDAIEFAHVRRLVAAALDGKNPEPGRAILLLTQFASREITSEERRGASYLEAAKALVDAITVADKKRLEDTTKQNAATPSTSWFAHILTTGSTSDVGPVPVVTTQRDPQSSALAQRLESLGAGKASTEGARGVQRHALNELDKEARSGFVRAEHLSNIGKPLSAPVLSKLGAETSADAVLKVSKLLTHDQAPIGDKLVLTSLRTKVAPSSPIGKVLALVAPSPSDAIKELREITGKLKPEEVTEFESLFEKERLFLSAEARIARLESALAALSDAEHEEFLAFFEASTRRTLGRALIQDSTVGLTESSILVSLAKARVVTNNDLVRFYDTTIPSDRSERAAVMAAQLTADAQRAPVDRKAVEDLAKSLQPQLRSLEIAAMSAATTQRLDLLSEITSKMRALEAQIQGKVAQSLATESPTYAARQGVSALLRATALVNVRGSSDELDTRLSAITALARDLEPLLRAKDPKTEAAFNRIRQANLSEEETLLLKAAYTIEVSNPTALATSRPTTGDLAKDLAPLQPSYPFETTRVERLMVGGRDALAEADLETLKIAAAVKDEKTQLETLANLRAIGEYEKFKEKIAAAPLSTSAQKYHQAVVSGDKVQADMTDLKIKAKNGDLKTTEVASFLVDKSAEDYRRIQAADPNFTKAVQATDPAFFDKNVTKLFSDNAAERAKALEQAMLKSLSDPELFAQWLRVPQTKEARVEAIRSLEALVEKQPTAPKFVTSGDPLKDELKIVQYIRAQKTDYREIDALLIRNIILTALSKEGALDDLTIRQIRDIRIQAAAQLREVDTFIQPRKAIVEAARGVLKMYESSQVWAEGDPVLKQLQYGYFGGFFQSSAEVDAIDRQRANRIAYLQATYPELANLTEKKLEKGERGTRIGWTSGYLLDDHIERTRGRIGDQRALLAPMERGLADLFQTRELMRATFGLMAKDASERVFAGLTPEVTQSAMVLLKQRQAKVTYKVTNEVEHEKWVKSASDTQSALSDRDFYTSVGLTVVKAAVVLTVAVIAPWGSPILAPFIVACLFNAGDKLYRGLVNGESWSSLGKAALTELGIDTVFLAISWVKLSAVIRPGKAAAHMGVKTVKVATEVSTPRWIAHQAKEAAKKAWSWVFKSAEPAKKTTGFVFHKEWLPKTSWWSGTKNIFTEWPKKFGLLLQDGLKTFYKNGDKVLTKAKVPGDLNWSQVNIKASGRLLGGRWQSSPIKSVNTPIPHNLGIDDGAIKKKAPVTDTWGNEQKKILTPPIPDPHPGKALTEPALSPAIDPLAGMAAFVVRKPTDGLNPPAAAPPATPPATPAAPADPGNKPTGAGDGPTSPAAPGNQPPPASPPPPKDAPGAGDPPAEDPPGRAMQHQPPSAHAGNVGGDGDTNNKSKSPAAAGPSVAVAQPSDPVNLSGVTPGVQQGVVPGPQQSAQTVPNIGNGSSNVTGTGLTIGFADDNQRAQATSRGIPTQNANGVPVAVVLDIEMATAASNRASVQAALMHNVTATAHTAVQAEKQVSHAIGHTLQPVENATALAERNRRREATATAQVQLVDELITHGVAERARNEIAARMRERVSSADVEMIVHKAEAPRVKDTNIEIEKVESEKVEVAAQGVRQSESTPQTMVSAEREATVEAVVAQRAQGEGERERDREVVHAAPTSPRTETAGEVSQVAPAAQRGEAAAVAFAETVRETEARVAIQERAHEERPHTPAPEERITPVTVEAGAKSLTAMVEAHAASRSLEIAEALSQRDDVSLRIDVSLRTEVVAEATPTFYAPQLHGPTVHAQSGGDAHSGSDDSSGSTAPKKRGHKADKAQAARKRELIMQQLMAQHLTKMQREKLLKALIELGISEHEYRSLVAKLGEMASTQLAQQQAARKKFAEPIAVAQEFPALKESPMTTERGSAQGAGTADGRPAKSPVTASTQTTRAKIYKRLKEEAATKRKSA